MSRRTSIAAAIALAVAACTTAGQTGGICDNTNIQQFVGQQRTAQLEAQMQQVSGAAVVRWVPHGTVITMEFRADRLTVFLDANDRVERISCS